MLKRINLIQPIPQRCIKRGYKDITIVAELIQ